MAEAKNVSFGQIMKDLEARKFVPVYYLMGEESYYIDRIADYIADHVLQPEERDFNQTVLFGSDVTASQIADYARRYPMMAEYQVVIVKEAQNVKQTEPLEKYFKAPLRSTILVMCHKNGAIDGRKKEYVKAIQGAGVLFESKKLKDRDLPVFIERYLGAKNVKIDPKSTQMISDNIGADLSRLTSELDKVILSLPEYKANLIIKYFDENPKAGSLYSFLPMLFNFFQNLMIAYYAPNNKSQEAVGEWLELRNSWAAKDYMVGMRNYTGVKTMQIISKIREIDAKSKGLDNPNTPPGELMKELIFYILH